MKYIISILLIIGVIIAGRFIFFSKNSPETSLEPVSQVQAKDFDREQTVDIESGMTFSDICAQVGIDHAIMLEMAEASSEVYDLAKVRVGRKMKFYFDRETGVFTKLIYPIDTEEELFVTPQEDGSFLAERKDIEYEVVVKKAEGTIDSSLYESAAEQDTDVRAIIDLAEIFAWTIDFGVGIREGDTYKFIFEERYRNGEYVMPGKILAAQFVNDGRLVEGYYFSEGQNEEGVLEDGYYNPAGESLQRIFLKNPVEFRYISSGFTTGPRYIAEFSAYTSSHRAIDYVAGTGTPVRAVGDGTVMSAGWNSGGYGNLIKIRHNETYSTNYAHLSKIYVKAGQHVTQGDVIGAVGSTGYSTGPHLHYEMVQNGTKINPLTIEFPASEGIAEDEMEEFSQAIVKLQEQLNN
ncbi:hypothetical protein C4566_02490 [Candidatus Parcubacteria bacterium]|nr:MAG: hypothetical protein C4566_02490 [Candidatus Parcubacteria bacterium]